MRNINRMVFILAPVRLFPHPLHDNASKRTSIASTDIGIEWKLLPISRCFRPQIAKHETLARGGGFIHEIPGNDTGERMSLERSETSRSTTLLLSDCTYRANPLDPELFKRIATHSLYRFA